MLKWLLLFSYMNKKKKKENGSECYSLICLSISFFKLYVFLIPTHIPIKGETKTNSRNKADPLQCSKIDSTRAMSSI